MMPLGLAMEAWDAFKLGKNMAAVILSGFCLLVSVSIPLLLSWFISSIYTF